MKCDVPLEEVKEVKKSHKKGGKKATVKDEMFLIVNLVNDNYS